MVRFALILIIRLYQSTLSLVLPSSCRFSPSCSQYMIDSIDKHGAFRGFWCGMKRILRCHPFSKHNSWDPV